MAGSRKAFLFVGICLGLIIGFIYFSTGCSKKSSVEVSFSPAVWPDGELERFAKLNDTGGVPKPLAEGTRGMVAGVQNALAVRAGLEALKQGGNAIDAALTTALAQTVLSMGSGMTQAGIMEMIYFDAATAKVYTLNADWNSVQEEKDPLTIPVMGIPSGRTALVPGFMAGVQAAHDRFGKLPFAKLFEPAIYFAEKGFVLSPGKAKGIEFRKDVLTRLPEARQVFSKPNGELFRAGELFTQPQLAETLRRVSLQGADYMYRGEWAKKFVDIVRRDGGKMTLKDLEDYKVLWPEPSRTTYRDYQICAPGSPNFMGPLLVEAFNLLELADLPHWGHYTTSPEALYWFIQISRAANTIPPFRSGGAFEKYLPGVDLSLESRMKKETSKLIWAKMQTPDWARLKKEEYESSLKQVDSMKSVLESLKQKKNTDAVVAVDDKGNVAAIVHTCNCAYWGTTGIFVDGVAVPDSAAFKQALIKWAGPGARLPHELCPVLVLKDQKPVLATGSAGSGLYEMTLQNVINVLDYGRDPKAAVDTVNFLVPERIASESNMQTITEGEFSEEIIKAVRAMGQDIKIVAKSAPHTLLDGYWIGVKIDPVTRKLLGGATKLTSGYALGY